MPITLTGAPPAGTIGVPYSYAITPIGGTGPYAFSVPGFVSGGSGGHFTAGVYTFSVATREFPPGFALDSATGIISGTPAIGGSFEFPVRVTDSLGATADFSLTITIPLVFGNNVYTLKDYQLTDDDYGVIAPYYVTFFAPTAEQEQALQLGGGRKMLAYLSAFIDANSYLHIGCNLTLTFYGDTLLNPLNLTVGRAIPPNAIFDLECGAAVAIGQRVAVKFASSPRDGFTDNAFNLTRLALSIRPAVHLPVRGASQ